MLTRRHLALTGFAGLAVLSTPARAAAPIKLTPTVTQLLTCSKQGFTETGEATSIDPHPTFSRSAAPHQGRTPATSELGSLDLHSPSKSLPGVLYLAPSVVEGPVTITLTAATSNPNQWSSASKAFTVAVAFPQQSQPSVATPTHPVPKAWHEAFAASGNDSYVLYSGADVNGQETLYVAHRDHGTAGSSFTAGVRIPDVQTSPGGGGFKMTDSHSIVAAPNGVVFVSFAAGTPAGNGGATGGSIWATMSSDAGKTWAPAVMVYSQYRPSAFAEMRPIIRWLPGDKLLVSAYAGILGVNSQLMLSFDKAYLLSPRPTGTAVPIVMQQTAGSPQAEDSGRFSAAPPSASVTASSPTTGCMTWLESSGNNRIWYSCGNATAWGTGHVAVSGASATAKVYQPTIALAPDLAHAVLGWIEGSSSADGVPKTAIVDLGNNATGAASSLPQVNRVDGNGAVVQPATLELATNLDLDFDPTGRLWFLYGTARNGNPSNHFVLSTSCDYHPSFSAPVSIGAPNDGQFPALLLDGVVPALGSYPYGPHQMATRDLF